MRQKYLILGFSLIVLLAVSVYFAGCSKDDNPTNQVTEGSLTEPEFVPVQTQVNDFLDSTVQIFSDALDNSARAPIDTQYVRTYYSPLGPNDTVTCVYLNGWYIVYVAKDNPYMSFHNNDSIQFQNNSVVVENPIEMDYMHFIRHWEFVSKLTSVTHTSINGDVDLEFSGLDGQVATVNGNKNYNVEWNYLSNDTSIVALYDMVVTVDSVTIYHSAGSGWPTACPSGGTLQANIAQTLTVTEGSVSNTLTRNWVATVAINEGVASVRVEGLNKVWNYTVDFCDPLAH